MKTLMRISVVLLVVLLAGVLLLAQERGERPRRGPRGERGERRGRGMAKAGQGVFGLLRQVEELDLTEEQREKIAKLREDFQEKTQENGEKMREAFRAMRKFREENPDDMEGLRKKRQEMQEAVAPMREATQAFIEEVKGVLNEEQLKKFNEILAQRGGGRMGRFGRRGVPGMPGLDPRSLAELDLTDEQKEKVKGLLEQFVKAQRELVDKYQGLFKEMLTPEQQEKFEKTQAEARERMQRPGRRGARRPRPERDDRPRRRRERPREEDKPED